MGNQPQLTTVIDPDSVPETLCDGPFNISVLGPLATITFTHIRPDVSQVFAKATFVPIAIVRARIVMGPPSNAPMDGGAPRRAGRRQRGGIRSPTCLCLETQFLDQGL